MREIQDIHHPEDQRQAGGYEKEKTSVCQAVQEKDDCCVHDLSFTRSNRNGTLQNRYVGIAGF